MMGYNIFNKKTPGKFCRQPKQFVIGLLIILLASPTTTFSQTSTGVNNNKEELKSTSQLLIFCIRSLFALFMIYDNNHVGCRVINHRR